MELEDLNYVKVTEPDFPGNSIFFLILVKSAQNGEILKFFHISRNFVISFCRKWPGMKNLEYQVAVQAPCGENSK